jgi:hypothetical protein
MRPQDLALLPLVSAVVLLVIAAYSPQARWTRYRYYIAFSLVLVGMVLFALPAFWAVDTHSGGSTDQESARKVEPESIPGSVIGKDVYFKIDGPISGPPAPRLTARDYPQVPLPYPLSESRIVMWVLGQQHLYFGAFVLGALFWIMGLELRGLLARKADAAERYDSAAQDVLGLVVLAVSGAAISGAVLLLAFVSLYPDFAKYLIGVFRPFVWLYGLLFIAFSVAIYLYYYMWQRMASGFEKWIHATLGVVVNVIGNVIMMIGNSWGSFMMSPAGVDAHGQFLGNYVLVLHNALWNPFNVHRFASHLIFGAAVIAAYAGYRALKAETEDQRTLYDGMCRAAVLALFFVLVTVPFGGYWLLREIYAYRQQMGITLLGGLLAWISIVRVILVGILFLVVNYYLWRTIEFTPGGARYRPHAKWIFLILTIAFIVYMTPHTLVMRAVELKAIGGQQHPVIGNYGVESSKQPAVNIMIAATMWSLLILRRSRYELGSGRSAIDVALIGLFVVGSANIIWLGIIGYFIPANVRVGLSVPMVMTTLHIVIAGALLTQARVHQAKLLSQGAARRPLSWKGYLAVLAMAATVTWLVAIGGYQRSSVRLFWHAMEIFRDNSPWAFTHTIGFMANVMAFNTLLFWSILVFLVWLRSAVQGSSATIREGPAPENQGPRSWI